jgi:ligand-binding sensor domain-containing protein/signal transduction histidine kinase
MLKHFRAGVMAGLLLCGALAGRALAAGTGASLTNDFIVWDTERDELLPQSSVIAMTQTHDGYLWLGTMKGLVRFDGMRTEVFDEFNTPGLGNSTIVHLFEDSRRRLWVGTERAGVVLIKDGKVTPQKIGRGGPASRLVAACEDARGAVWLFTVDGGLFRVRGDEIDTMLVTEERGLSCHALIAEKDGPVRVGTDQRLRTIQPEAVFEKGRLPSTVEAVTNLNFLLASPRGGYWRLADGRIQKWNSTGMERDLGTNHWNQLQNPITAACEDAEGSLFIGTWGNGVFRYDVSGDVTHLSSPEVLNHSTVLSLCLDRDGSLWVGTDGGGVNRVQPKRFQVLPGLGIGTVQLVTEDASGGLWFAFNGGGLNYWKDGALQEFDPAPGLNVRAVLVDRRQTVWVGGIVGGGIFQFVDGGFRPAPGTEAIRPQVQAMFEDQATNLWVGTQQGLLRWNGRDWQGFTTREGLTVNSVRAFAEDGAGNFWIGTDGGGLNLWRDGKFSSQRQSADGLPSDSITALLADTEGALWVGTSGRGLARWRDGKWTRYTQRDGLSGNSITYLLEDGDGFLWIGSNEGLMRAEKKALNDFATGSITSLQVRTFRKADGLPTKECTSGSQPAACRARDGRLWFPTTKGLVGVNPAQLHRNTNPPPVLIESVLVDGRPQNTNALQVTWPHDLIVPAGRERVEIHFTSLNLAAPERARFRYQLGNHETQWTETREREVSFTRLPADDYRFQVTACNEDGVWNSNPATLVIIIEPPFWRAWWFLTISGAALLGAIVGTVHFLSTQKLQRQLAQLKQQEALEKERARIARDLHDQLGANLTQVSLLGELVETDKDLPEEVEAHARQISTTARETAHALDEIVWAANPANDTLEGLITYTCKYAQEYLAVAGLSYRLEAPEKLPPVSIPPEVRHNIFLAFKESVNNVVKHAHATAVKVRVRLAPNRFIIEIEDNGRGVAEADKAKGRNGLRNMSQRMEDVRGEFSLEPGAEGGTLIRLTAPLGKPTL